MAEDHWDFGLRRVFGNVGIYMAVRPDLLLNPINRRIMLHAGPGWGVRTDLIPTPIEVGTSEAQLLEMLTNAGFERVTDHKAWRYTSEFELGRQVFVRDANRFPCQIRNYVIVGFDDRKSVLFAEGTQEEHGCL